MRSIHAFLAVLWLALSFQAAAAPSLIPAPPKLASSAYLLIDQNSGHVLAEHNSTQRIEPASLTKLMTAYVVFHAIENGTVNLEDKVRISKKARYMEGSRMFVEQNSLVSVEELLKGLIIQSGNDASVALAEHLAESEESFVALMNQHAENLGMSATHFVNSTGLPDAQHYTTAKDLALLSRALIHDYPDYYTWYRIKSYRHNGITQPNRNKLLWLDDRVDGMKTGHTESAGYCLIASALRNDMRLISIVLGTVSENARASASRKLLNYGFRFYETFPLHNSNEPLTNMRIWKGESEQVALGLKQDLFVTTPRGKRHKIKAHMKVDSMIMAPAKKGQQYGTVNVMLDDKLLVSRPLVALTDVAEGGMWRKLVDNIKLMFN